MLKPVCLVLRNNKMPLLLQINIWNFTSILLSLIVVFISYCKWKFTYWSRRGVVAPVASIPLGNATRQFMGKETLGESIATVYNKFKSKGLRYCGYYLMVQPMWLVFDLDLLKTIMTKDFDHFMDHGNYINEKNDPLTGQLFMLKGTKWRTLRAKLTPTFTSGKMKAMFPTLLDCSRELVVVMDKTAGEKVAIDIKDVVARFATDVIGSCAFGIDCNSLKDPNSVFRIQGNKVVHPTGNKLIRMLMPSFLSNYPRLMDLFKVRIFPKDVTDFFLALVNETVNYREQNGIVRKDFMHLLIQLKNNIAVNNKDEECLVVQNNQKPATTLTIEEITAQAFVFFLAGYETSSTTLTFCLYELASIHELQDRVRREVVGVFKKYNGELTYEALNKMVYLEMCINETLRKYPPLPVIQRECTKTYKVPDSNVVIDKGTKVLIPLFGIQRDPELFPSPETFDPERFNAENKEKQRPFSWLPFGEGPRICIGIRFGVMLMKVGLSILLKNYKFSVNKKTPDPLVLNPQSFVTATKNCIWLDVEKI